MGAKRIKNFLAYVGVIVLLLIILFPVVYIFISSFKPLRELIMSGAGFFPQKPTLANYVSLIFVRTPIRNFPVFLLNSLKVSIGTALLSVLIASLGGYGLARYQYPGRGILTQSMLFIYVFPTVLLLIPIYRMFLNLKLLDTHLGLIIIYTALAAPFCTWLLTSFFKTIPIELEEAASIDGANKMTIFLKITFPLAASGIVAVAVYSFIISWGEYMFASILLSSSGNRTAPLGLATLTAEQYIEWGPLLAGSILIILPVIVLFFPVARQFIKGVMGGAIKQ
jgi:ABC-type glycerol-3-phosphate transport system permease component